MYPITYLDCVDKKAKTACSKFVRACLSPGTTTKAEISIRWQALELEPEMGNNLRAVVYYHTVHGLDKTLHICQSNGKWAV